MMRFSADPISIIRPLSPISIDYCTAYGTESTRIIRPIRYFESMDGKNYLVAFCTLRGEERTFRLDRVHSWGYAEEGSYSQKKEPWGDSATSAQAWQSQNVNVASGTKASASTVSSTGAYNRSTPLSSTSNAEKDTRKSNKGGGWFFKLAFAGIVFAVVRAFIAGGGYKTEAVSSSQKLAQITSIIRQNNRYVSPYRRDDSTAALDAAALVLAASQNSGNPSALKYSGEGDRFVEEYRDVEIRSKDQKGHKQYYSPQFDIIGNTLRDVHYDINALLFRAESRLDDPNLEALYSGADRDQNGHLSWGEVESFQQRAQHRYEYRENGKALSPSSFITQGGGDCEDWALYTCGLLRYWGWNCLVGSFGDDDEAHALALVRSPKKIEHYGSIQIYKETVIGTAYLRPGFYIPIDYEYVGSLSNAVKAGWYLRWVYKPEAIYERAM